mmetsp:Transcript_91805/g.273941  ORF Transcript_91805/g.273941 Transcript_91805/m.273941 type:complete len:201 (+) Transcript_91805:564-1166(+)
MPGGSGSSSSAPPLAPRALPAPGESPTGARSARRGARSSRGGRSSRGVSSRRAPSLTLPGSPSLGRSLPPREGRRRGGSPAGGRTRGVSSSTSAPPKRGLGESGVQAGDHGAAGCSLLRAGGKLLESLVPVPPFSRTGGRGGGQLSSSTSGEVRPARRSRMRARAVWRSDVPPPARLCDGHGGAMQAAILYWLGKRQERA